MLQNILDALGQAISSMGTALSPAWQVLERLFSGFPAAFSGLDPAYEVFYISLVRHACPVLAFLLLLRCAGHWSRAIR